MVSMHLLLSQMTDERNANFRKSIPPQNRRFDQVRKVERENRKLLRMWSTTRARLLEAEEANCIAQGDETLLQETANPSKAPTSQQETVELAAGRSRKRTRLSTRKGEPPAKADSDKGNLRQPVLGVAAEDLFDFAVKRPRGRGSGLSLRLFCFGRQYPSVHDILRSAPIVRPSRSWSRNQCTDLISSTATSRPLFFVLNFLFR